MRDFVFALTVSAGLFAGLLGSSAALRAGAADVGFFQIAAFN
jgi:hypothetical protein